MNLKNMKKNKIILILLLVSFMFFSGRKININEEKGAVISISVTTSGMLQKGYGITMTLTNNKTKENYKTKSMGLISSHCFIFNLPAGIYNVTKIEVPLGQFIYSNKSIELTNFFGDLEFKDNNIYYLGNFYGERNIGVENVFYLSLKDENIPDKIIKKLNNKGYKIDKQYVVKTYPYSKNELKIY